MSRNFIRPLLANFFLKADVFLFNCSIFLSGNLGFLKALMMDCLLVLQRLQFVTTSSSLILSKTSLSNKLFVKQHSSNHHCAMCLWFLLFCRVHSTNRWM
ncbi:25992_t:CDS:1, partial [Gigaspora rosea]